MLSIGAPLITQSDRGTENNSVANIQTLIRQRLDPTLEGTLQHRWVMASTHNIKPEAFWSYLRHNFSPGFENVLQHAVDSGLHDPNSPLDRLVFLWLAVPWLQSELDQLRHRYNHSARRSDKHKILPQGKPPQLIRTHPEQFGCRDYKVIAIKAIVM